LLNLFIQKRVDVNTAGKKKKNTPLHIAAKKNKLDLVKVLLQAKANPLARNKGGKTPLGKLLRQKATHQIKHVLSALVGAGANPNELDEDGNTPLHRIVSSDATLLDTVVVRSLLEVGADPTIRNPFDKTPLQVLAEDFEGEGNVKEVLKAYLQNGPSWKTPNEPAVKLFYSNDGRTNVCDWTPEH